MAGWRKDPGDRRFYLNGGTPQAFDDIPARHATPTIKEQTFERLERAEADLVRLRVLYAGLAADDAGDAEIKAYADVYKGHAYDLSFTIVACRNRVAFTKGFVASLRETLKGQPRQVGLFT